MKTQSLKISSGDLVEGGQTFGELVFEPLSGTKAKLVSLIALLGNEVQNTGPSPVPLWPTLRPLKTQRRDLCVLPRMLSTLHHRGTQ